MHSGNILILTNWSYKDALIQSYTLPYVMMIRDVLDPSKKIIVRTLEQKKYNATTDEKIAIRREFKEKNIQWVSSRYSQNSLKALFYYLVDLARLVFLCYKYKIKIIHIWCTPPAIIAYPLSLITGAEIVLDSYEPHAESMVENGAWTRESLKFKLLFWFEKAVSRKAKVVISATSGMKDYAQNKYGVLFDNFYVKPACVNIDQFSFKDKKKNELLERFGLQNKIVGLYAGKFGGIYLEREFFDLAKEFVNFYGDNFRMLILTSHSRKEIEERCKACGLDHENIISMFVPHKAISEYMGLADFAITPVKPVPSKRYCTPIKNGEYWALGLPVVITPNISDDSDIILENDIGVVLEGFNEEEYRKVVREIDRLLKQYTMKELYDKIRYIAIRYRSLEIAEEIYKQNYN